MDEMDLPADDAGEPMLHHLAADVAAWIASPRSGLDVVQDPNDPQLFARACGCKDTCWQRMSLAKSQEQTDTKQRFNKMSHSDQDVSLISCIQIHRKSRGHEKHQYSLFGEAVCMRGFAILLNVGELRVQKLAGALDKEGGVPPKDMRSMPMPSESTPRQAHVDVDAFFRWAYDNLAEPFAETDQCMPDDDPGDDDDDDDGGDIDLVEADVVDNPVAATMQTLAKDCKLKWIAPTTMD